MTLDDDLKCKLFSFAFFQVEDFMHSDEPPILTRVHGVDGDSGYNEPGVLSRQVNSPLSLLSINYECL